jgi:hypothetical protein
MVCFPAACPIRSQITARPSVEGPSLQVLHENSWSLAFSRHALDCEEAIETLDRWRLRTGISNELTFPVLFFVRDGSASLRSGLGICVPEDTTPTSDVGIGTVNSGIAAKLEINGDLGSLNQLTTVLQKITPPFHLDAPMSHTFEYIGSVSWHRNVRGYSLDEETASNIRISIGMNRRHFAYRSCL